MASPDEVVAHGKEAELLLQNPLIRQTIEQLKREYFDKWRLTTDDEKEKREKLWIAYNLIDMVYGDLCQVAANGRLIQREMDEKDRAKQAGYVHEDMVN